MRGRNFYGVERGRKCESAAQANGGGGGSAHMIDSISKGCMVGMGYFKRIVSFNFLWQSWENQLQTYKVENLILDCLYIKYWF